DACADVTTCAPGTFFMAVPPVLSDLVDAPNAPNRSGQDGRTATQSSTRSRTTSPHACRHARLVHVQRARTLHDPLHDNLRPIDDNGSAVRRSLASQASLKHVLKATVRG